MEINEDEFLTMQKKCGLFDSLNHKMRGCLKRGNVRVVKAECLYEAAPYDISTDCFVTQATYSTKTHNIRATIELLICQ